MTKRVTIEEGEEFYLVIEQGSSNKVHLLNTVTLDDLTALADDGNKSEKKDSLLEALKGGESEETGDITTESSENTNNNTVSNDKKSSNIYLYILIAIGGGAYYYFKVYKNKKNESMDIMDAMDMDDFIMEEDEDEEDLDLDEKEKQELLHQLINGEYEDEEVFQNMSLEEYGEEDRDTYEEEEIYATSHKPEDGMENILDSNLETKITEEETIESDYLMDMDGETFDEELDGEENE